MLKTIEFKFSSYGLMTALGIIAAVWFLYCRSERYKMKPKTLLCSVAIIVAGMAVGSRVVFVLSQIPTAIAGESLWWLWKSLVSGGFVFYGGLYGALLGTLISAKLFKQETDHMINYFIPGFPVFHCFGRIGCFLAGCCYGIPSSFGIIQPEIDTVARLPVQLMEAIYNVVIVVVLLVWEERRGKQGKRVSLLPVYLLMYAPFRFVLEFFRDDGVRGRFGILTTSQWISLITLAVLLILFLLQRKKRAKSARA